jgi:hypothetical protein
MEGSRRRVHVTERQESERCAERGWRRTAAARLGVRSKVCPAARRWPPLCCRRGSREGAECGLLRLWRVTIAAAGCAREVAAAGLWQGARQAAARQRRPRPGARCPAAARGAAGRRRRLAVGLRLGARAAAAGRAAGLAAGGVPRPGCGPAAAAWRQRPAREAAVSGRAGQRCGEGSRRAAARAARPRGLVAGAAPGRDECSRRLGREPEEAVVPSIWAPAALNRPQPRHAALQGLRRGRGQLQAAARKQAPTPAWLQAAGLLRAAKTLPTAPTAPALPAALPVKPAVTRPGYRVIGYASARRCSSPTRCWRRSATRRPCATTTRRALASSWRSSSAPRGASAARPCARTCWSARAWCS